MRKILLFLSIFLLNLSASEVKMSEFFLDEMKFDLSLYPKAESGKKQHIIALKPQEDESEFRIEIEFGKKVLVDCNHHFFLGGELKEHEISGYGYEYFEFIGENKMAGTLMMCHAEKTTKFVSYHTKFSPRYNSKLPIVIYTKDDIVLRVKIYKEIARKDI